jgi:hypothetical protein
MNVRHLFNALAAGGLLAAVLPLQRVSAVLAARPVESAAPGLMQFTAGGHALGFAPDGVYAAAGSHALHVEFVGANTVHPQSDSSVAEQGQAAALGRVTYSGLWDGIDLAFTVDADGIYATAYTLAPGADPAQIRLRYNAPVVRNEDGTLSIAFETGTLTESAPVAWQEIGGVRVPVEAAFRVSGQEAGFALGAYDPRYPLSIDPTLEWNTFLGGSGNDTSTAIAVDGSGNIYVVGYSSETWGTPLHAFTGGWDLLVARLNDSGELVWHTFYGGSGTDWGYSIAQDSSGNLLVAGDSTATWGTPVSAYTASVGNGFAAKFGTDGSLIWNTFLGGSGDDAGNSIAVDIAGNAYIAGSSTASWGSPVRAYTDQNDAFVAKLTTSGGLTWLTFLGGSGDDAGYGITVDGSGVYTTGITYASWGTPVRAYTSSGDAFAAKVNMTNGSLIWNTFLGGSEYDSGRDLELYSTSLYVTGFSLASWGSPVRAYTSDYDAFVVRLVSSTGELTWNTFLGGSGADKVYDIIRDGSGYINLTGSSDASWGNPLRAYTGNYDAYAAKITTNGELVSNLFLGYGGGDSGLGIRVRGFDVYVTGSSTGTWGDPVRAYTSATDLFVAKVNLTLPGEFHKLSPADGAYTATNPTLGWEESGGADYYIYCIDTIDNGTCDTSWIGTGSSTGAALSGLDNNQTYYWFVAATNTYGTVYADEGTWWSFTARHQTFADVPIDHVFWEEIEAFYGAGITTGCGVSPLIYCPEDNVTRAAMAVFLLRTKYGGGYAPPPATHTFADLPVAGKEWQEAWVDQFFLEGITTGCGVSPLIYCPEDPVTRAAMAVFILRTIEGPSYTPPPADHYFADMPVAGKEWMEPWVDEFYRRGITTGCGTGPLIYCPEDAVKRQAMAAFIVRAFALPLP